MPSLLLHGLLYFLLLSILIQLFLLCILYAAAFYDDIQTQSIVHIFKLNLADWSKTLPSPPNYVLHVLSTDQR